MCTQAKDIAMAIILVLVYLCRSREPSLAHSAAIAILLVTAVLIVAFKPQPPGGFKRWLKKNLVMGGLNVRAYQ